MNSIPTEAVPYETVSTTLIITNGHIKNCITNKVAGFNVALENKAV